jgi:eukaryotic-like serine/threonine-protein kinase
VISDPRLAAFVREYQRQAAPMSFAELRRRQPAPTATVAHGAAGLAFALGRAGHPDAARWSAAAWGARARTDALRGPGIRAPAASIFCGRAGLALVEVTTRGARLDELLRLCRPRRGSVSDLMFGAAGALCACAALLGDVADPRLRVLGDRLAEGLLDDGRPDPRAPLGFAHGVAGIHHALLRWSEAAGFELPPRFFRSLDKIARTPLSAYPAALQRTWCNGSAGVALLMAAASRRTGRRAYLDQARAAVTHAVADERALADLCCGLAGRAYAALALDAIDRKSRGRWRRRAEELAAQAVTQFASRWPNGLLRGAPGLVCLALDLRRRGPARFPIVEG